MFFFFNCGEIYVTYLSVLHSGVKDIQTVVPKSDMAADTNVNPKERYIFSYSCSYKDIHINIYAYI